MQIIWLGHSTFEIRLPGGETIVIDPWLGQPSSFGFPYPEPFGNPSYPKGYEIQNCDVMLISHGHYDHLSGAKFLADKFSPAVITNFEIGGWLESKGFQNVTGMNIGGMASAGPIQVTMTNAVHSSSISSDGQTIPGGSPAGFVLHFAGGRRLYYTGDTAVHSDMALIEQIYKPELCILPIGDLFTMGPEQAAAACRILRPKKVIGAHYATFPPLTGTPAALRDRIQDLPETEVVELVPGEPYEW